MKRLSFAQSVSERKKKPKPHHPSQASFHPLQIRKLHHRRRKVSQSPPSSQSLLWLFLQNLLHKEGLQDMHADRLLSSYLSPLCHLQQQHRRHTTEMQRRVTLVFVAMRPIARVQGQSSRINASSATGSFTRIAAPNCQKMLVLKTHLCAKNVKKEVINLRRDSHLAE
jgi:hypothetical protein